MTPWLRDFIDNRIFGPNHRWWALWVVVISVFIATTDVGMLTISLPVIITEFRTDITFAGWIVFVYALVTGALYLPCGRLSDLLGRKLTFSAGFLVYGVASLLAGVAQGPTQLMTCRVGQAVGAALMMTNTFALTGSLFTGPDRGRAMGLSGGLVSAIGFTLGPVVGGFITFTLGWRYIFFISGTLSFIGLAAARFLLLDDRESGAQAKREPFDFAGAGLFAVALTFLLLGITRGGLGYWGFVLSALFAALFIWREATFPYPILDLGLLRIVPFAVGNLARLSTFVALSTNELMMPFLLQLVLRMDPLEAGSLMTATALVLMVVSPSAGWLTDRVGSTPPAAAGAAVIAVAMYAMSHLGPDSGPAEIVPRLALLGVGLGLFQTPNNHGLIGSVPHERLGIASSVISIIRSVGRSLGTAIATAFVGMRLAAVTNDSGPQDLTALNVADNPLLLGAFMEGYGYAYVTAACLGLSALAFTLIAAAGRGSVASAGR